MAKSDLNELRFFSKTNNDFYYTYQQAVSIRGLQWVPSELGDKLGDGQFVRTSDVVEQPKCVVLHHDVVWVYRLLRLVHPALHHLGRLATQVLRNKSHFSMFTLLNLIVLVICCCDFEFVIIKHISVNGILIISCDFIVRWMPHDFIEEESTLIQVMAKWPPS